MNHFLAVAALVATILTQPERVETFRIVEPVRGDRKQLSKTREWIGGYLVARSAGVSAHREKAIEIAGAILSPTTGPLHRCAFQPGYAIRYWRGSRSVALLFCFHCGDFRLLPPAGSGEPAFGGDFSKISPAVVKFLRGEFPDDRDLIAMEVK